MNSVSFGTIEPQGNFLNLSLLICHLFAGGNFKWVNILYHPDAFDDGLLISIDSSCPFQIPKTTQDISRNETILIDRRSQRTDSILQLIFLAPDQLIQQFNGIEKMLTFYRIFIFTASSQLNELQNESIASKNKSSRTFVLVHNPLNGAINEYIITRSSIQLLDMNTNGLSSKEIFDSMFDDKTFGRFLVVSTYETLCESQQQQAPYELARKVQYTLGSLYFRQMKLSFVDRSIWDCKTKTTQHQNVRPVYRPYYSDYYFKYESAPDANK